MSYGAFTEIACCHEGCGEVIVAHSDVVARWRSTHERFHCPAGHRQHFVAKTEEEKRIEFLEAQVDKLNRWLDQVNEHWAERLDEMATCPYPTCGRHGYRYSSRTTLGRHLARNHGGTYPVHPPTEADEAGEAAA